jgi:hypothetical protein
MSQIEWPSNPEIGDIHTQNKRSWKWNGYAWDTLGPSGLTEPYPFYFQDTEPVGKIIPGSMWVDSSTAILYIYINDGENSQWISP